MLYIPCTIGFLYNVFTVFFLSTLPVCLGPFGLISIFFNEVYYLSKKKKKKKNSSLNLHEND